MTDKHCKLCSTVKPYDGEYRCMTCYRKFDIADTEDVMFVSETAVAPALARIEELEKENSGLKAKLEAMREFMNRVVNPEEYVQHPDQRSDG